MMKKTMSVITAIFLAVFFIGCSETTPTGGNLPQSPTEALQILESAAGVEKADADSGSYTIKGDTVTVTITDSGTTQTLVFNAALSGGKLTLVDAKGDTDIYTPYFGDGSKIEGTVWKEVQDPGDDNFYFYLDGNGSLSTLDIELSPNTKFSSVSAALEFVSHDINADIDTLSYTMSGNTIDVIVKIITQIGTFTDTIKITQVQVSNSTLTFEVQEEGEVIKDTFKVFYGTGAQVEGTVWENVNEKDEEYIYLDGNGKALRVANDTNSPNNPSGGNGPTILLYEDHPRKNSYYVYAGLMIKGVTDFLL